MLVKLVTIGASRKPSASVRSDLGVVVWGMLVTASEGR